jgi:hypothetical protein
MTLDTLDDNLIKENMSQPLIPAALGFMLLGCHFLDKDEVYITRAPIVAWRYDGFHAHPVATMSENSFDMVVLCPDGAISGIGEGVETYSSEDKWVESVVRVRAELRRGQND